MFPLNHHLHLCSSRSSCPGAICVSVTKTPSPGGQEAPPTPAQFEGGTKAWVYPHSPAGLSESLLGYPGTEANLGVAVWVMLGDGTPSGLQEPSWDSKFGDRAVLN